MNLQAHVIALAAVYILSGRRLGWLKELEIDVPLEAYCETNGPGDDVRLTLGTGSILEAQVKKGLNRGYALWVALDALASGIHLREIDFGLLIVDGESSGTIKRLARGIKRVADGRLDSLDQITDEFLVRLEADGFDAQSVCSRLRILVVHFADHDPASEQQAKTELARLCARDHEVQVSWSALVNGAHSLIERRGRWTRDALKRLLADAGVQVASGPAGDPPAPVSGFVWEQLDRFSPSRGFVQTFRNHYLVSEQTGTHAFGGRQQEFVRMDAWLSDPKAPGRMLLCAPTARGKSALLVQWTEGLESDLTWATIFVPISLRFGTDRPSVFHEILAVQIAAILNCRLAAPHTEADAYYRMMSATLIAQACEQGRHMLIVLDGLDEAQGGSFSSSIFPSALPPNIKILVSAREQAGDLGPEGWLRRLGWDRQVRVVSSGLSALDRAGVAAVLESVQIQRNSINDELVDRLWALSDGEPLLLTLYAEDLKALEERGGSVEAEALKGLTPGFNSYFSRAFDVQFIAGDRHNQDVADATLAVLALAVAPIEGQHLTDLVCNLANVPRPMVKDRFIRPIQRFVAGDGSRDHGYVLNHPKLGQYLREERFDVKVCAAVNEEMAAWGREVVRSLGANPDVSVPRYVLRHFVDHMLRLPGHHLSDVESLLIDGWRRAWFEADRDYAGYAMSLIAAAAAIPRCADEPDPGRILRTRLKIALLVGSVRSQSISMPQQLLGLSLDANLLSLPQALNVASLQEKSNIPLYLLAIGSHLSQEALSDLRAIIAQTDNLENRYRQLAQLAQHLSEPSREEVVREVLAWISLDGEVPTRFSVVCSLTHALNNQQLEDVLVQLAARPVPVHQCHGAAMALGPLVGELQLRQMQGRKKSVLQTCLRWIEQLVDVDLAAMCLRVIAPYLDKALLEAQLSRLTALADVKRHEMASSVSNPLDVQDEIRRAHFMEACLTLAVIGIRDVPDDQYGARLQEETSALIHPDYWCVGALSAIVPLVRDDVRQDFVRRLSEVASRLHTANNRTHALMTLASRATSHLRQQILVRALSEARHIEDAYAVSMALSALFAVLSVEDRAREFDRLLEDVRKINFGFHLGTQLFELSDQMPPEHNLAEAAANLVLGTTSVGNGVVSILMNLSKLPEESRKPAFDECWRRMVNSNSPHTRVQFAWASQYAAEFWTIEHLETAVRELDRPGPDHYPRDIAGLLPVAIRLGVKDLVDRILELISSASEDAARTSMLAQAAKWMPLRDPERQIFERSWFESLESLHAHLSGLTDSFGLLDVSAQQRAWPALIERSRTLPASADVLLRLSQMATDPQERIALFEEALQACMSGDASQRFAIAARAAASAPTLKARLGAFDLLAPNSFVSRDVALHSIKQLAPIVANIDPHLVHGLMADIRESAAWWP